MWYYCVIVSHDFGLRILSQWENVVLLKFNNDYSLINSHLLPFLLYQFYILSSHKCLHIHLKTQDLKR